MSQHRTCLNDVALKKSQSISTTWLVFHAEMLPLKADAPKNIESIDITFLVSHPDKLTKNDDALLNMELIYAT